MGVEYKLLNQNSLEDVDRFLAKDFAEHELMSKILYIPPQELQKVFSLLIKASVKNSYIATDKTLDKVIGSIICNDFS